MRLIQSTSVVNQVEEILLSRIRENTYAAGSRIPSESELSEEFGVSRATVRTVLAKLAVNGLILRKHGDGTYVNPRILGTRANLGNLWDFWTLIESNGHKPRIEALSIELRAASEREATALALEPQETLLSMTRLFYADDQPVILAKNVIPVTYLHVNIDKIDGHLPIREILKQYCRQEIAFAITDIRSYLAGPDLAAVLGDKLGQTVLELQLSFYSKDNSPLALGVNYFNDSILRLCLMQAWS